MIFFKVAVITAAAMALTSAWSTQFPQIFRTFPQPPPLPQFAPFFQDPTATQPRFYAHHQPQFRHPLHAVVTHHPPPPAPPSLRDLPPQPVASDADVRHHQHQHHHHHHHVFHYYYSPADVMAAGRDARDRCDPVTVAGCPQRPAPTAPPQPGYLPPPSPSPPPPTPVAPPAARPPCDDDSVVVDNVDYFPFRGSPATVAAASSAGATSVKDGAMTGNPRRDDPVRQNVGGRESKSNFVLANYLLPPDK